MRLTDRLFVVGSRQLGISGPWDCHVYLVRGDRGHVLIDAGGGASGEVIAGNIAAEGLDPRDVRVLLVTHAHSDHVCGAAELRALTGCEVYVPAASRGLVERGTARDLHLDLAKEMGLYPPEFQFRNCSVDGEVKDGDRVDACGLDIEAIAVAGHSRDSMCYQIALDGRRHLFCGDVVFYGGVLGLINFPGSDMDGYRRDLPKLAGRAIDGLFPGHMLFTLRGGQQHVDAAIAQCRLNTIPDCIGRLGHVF